MRSLACRASFEARAICVVSTVARRRAASPRSSAARASSPAAWRASSESLREYRIIWDTLKIVAAETTTPATRIQSWTARSL
jgi:hypothetical protein